MASPALLLDHAELGEYIQDVPPAPLKLRRRRLRTLAAGMAGLLLVVAVGCGGSDEDSDAIKVQAGASAPSTAPNKNVTFRFTDLDDRVKFPIKVYPGVSESAEDTRYDGTYKDDEEVIADCKTTGRSVSYSDDVVQPAITSDQWVKLAADGEEQYASAVFIQEREQVLGELPEC